MTLEVEGATTDGDGCPRETAVLDEPAARDGSAHVHSLSSNRMPGIQPMSRAMQVDTAVGIAYLG